MAPITAPILHSIFRWASVDDGPLFASQLIAVMGAKIGTGMASSLPEFDKSLGTAKARAAQVPPVRYLFGERNTVRSGSVLASYFKARNTVQNFQNYI